MRYVYAPVGVDAPDPRPGDFILCHRRGLVSALIRWGERIRFRSGSRWSHVAVVMGPGTLAEALTRGVVLTPYRAYREIEYVLVRSDLSLSATDHGQALGFVRSCLGQPYGWLTILGVALRFLTPGRGLWFGLDGTEICSGMAAQMLVRGWANFKHNPSSLTPAELAESYGVPASLKEAKVEHNRRTGRDRAYA